MATLPFQLALATALVYVVAVHCLFVGVALAMVFSPPGRRRKAGRIRFPSPPRPRPRQQPGSFG